MHSGDLNNGLVLHSGHGAKSNHQMVRYSVHQSHTLLSLIYFDLNTSHKRVSDYLDWMSGIRIPTAECSLMLANYKNSYFLPNLFIQVAALLQEEPNKMEFSLKSIQRERCTGVKIFL